MPKNRLKIIRKAKGKTQIEIAKKASVSQNTYSYWENNKVKIDNNSYQKLADFYGVSIDFLSGRKYRITRPVELWRKDQQEDYYTADEYLKVYLEYKWGAPMFVEDDDEILDTDNNIEIAAKVALFGGDTEVTDDMWNDIMSYAEFVKRKYEKKQQGDKR